jgi:hypothetical protein
LPVPLTLAAAALGQYPLTYRTTLFLVPVVAVTLAEGVARVSAWASRRSAPIVAAGLFAAIAAGPVWWSANAALDPPRHEEIKPVLKHIRDRWREGDALYVHKGALYAFLYYANCGCFSLAGSDGAKLWPLASNSFAPGLLWHPVEPESRTVLVGPDTDDPTQQLNDLRRLRGRTRVWLVYSHVDRAESDFIRRRLLGRLGEMGMRVDVVDEPGAHAYLYALRHNAR